MGLCLVVGWVDHTFALKLCPHQISRGRPPTNPGGGTSFGGGSGFGSGAFVVFSQASS